MLDRTRDFLESNPKRREMVTVAGKQPSSDTWVFGPNLHFDSNGKIVPEEEQTHYW